MYLKIKNILQAVAIRILNTTSPPHLIIVSLFLIFILKCDPCT